MRCECLHSMENVIAHDRKGQTMDKGDDKFCNYVGRRIGFRKAARASGNIHRACLGDHGVKAPSPGGVPRWPASSASGRMPPSPGRLLLRGRGQSFVLDALNNFLLRMCREYLTYFGRTRQGISGSSLTHPFCK
ncbi:hypothetical protein CEXT_68921 [Caerostris extrusa]|uniref:Uncharacterized protein n=1 Tax=Caerostris extrusa TaxID=172846 RepID=A0AAV4THA4_CAEEX|nr:hypothetical protein CEXT_68921 [Caerostris extrusa]